MSTPVLPPIPTVRKSLSAASLASASGLSPGTYTNTSGGNYYSVSIDNKSILTEPLPDIHSDRRRPHQPMQDQVHLQSSQQYRHGGNGHESATAVDNSHSLHHHHHHYHHHHHQEDYRPTKGTPMLASAAEDPVGSMQLQVQSRPARLPRPAPSALPVPLSSAASATTSSRQSQLPSRRVGWWRTDADRLEQMNAVKALLRNQSNIEPQMHLEAAQDGNESVDNDNAAVADAGRGSETRVSVANAVPEAHAPPTGMTTQRHPETSSSLGLVPVELPRQPTPGPRFTPVPPIGYTSAIAAVSAPTPTPDRDQHNAQSQEPVHAPADVPLLESRQPASQQHLPAPTVTRIPAPRSTETSHAPTPNSPSSAVWIRPERQVAVELPQPPIASRQPHYQQYYPDQESHGQHHHQHLSTRNDHRLHQPAIGSPASQPQQQQLKSPTRQESLSGSAFLPPTVLQPSRAKQRDESLLQQLEAAKTEAADLRQKVARLEKRADAVVRLKRTLGDAWTSLQDIRSDNSLQTVSPHSIILHLWRQGMHNSILSFIKESVPDLSTNRTIKRLAQHLSLKKMMDGHDFTHAIVLVQTVMTDAIECAKRVHAPATNLVPSFEDLIYVLSKYLLIHLHQSRQDTSAIETLEQVLAPLVRKEQRRGGVRAEWFATDYQLLYDLVHRKGSGANNIYSDFNWGVELAKFWESAKLVGQTPSSQHSSQQHHRRRRTAGTPQPTSGHPSPPPLFAFALAEHFGVDESMIMAAPDLDQMAVDAEKWQRATHVITKYGIDVMGKGTLPGKPANRSGLPPSAEASADRGLDALAEQRDRSNQGANSSGSTAIATTQHEQMAMQPTPQQLHQQRVHTTDDQREIEPLGDAATKRPPRTADARDSGRYAADLSDNVDGSYASTPRQRKQPSSRSQSSRQRNRRIKSPDASTSTGDHSSQHMTPSAHAHLEPEMPPMGNVHETANFALSAVCGPSISQPRVLDVRDLQDTGQIIVATAGSEDRLDKGISIWDVRKGSLVTHLDNGTIKPIVALLFHPSYPELLLSADMDFDVKLWNWREGRVVRWWRKHHSRIINRMAWLPDDDTRLIHANEPITSFVFCGSVNDPMQQKVVVSLSFSIRIYKLRTLSMITSIPLNDLKINKTPITSLAVHPVFDNFILLSADNQLRLFDLSTQAFAKTYSARLIENGTRIRGDFSPCGLFVYAAATDIRQPASRKSRNGAERNGYAHGMNEQSLPAPAVGSSTGPLSSHGLGMDGPSSGAHGGASGSGTSGPNQGVFVWRLHTGKLEQAEMRAMDVTDGWDHAGAPVRPCAVHACKWTLVRDASKKGRPAKERKVLVLAGQDKLLRLYL
ncbi:hypothetical protein BC831DRAFT_448698 [Entophlyctis helioformis]|nr:hypothetical protein BC831DRAFT_448698 [Entophlyctis helioformis]